MSVLIKGMEMPKSCGNCFYDTRCDNWRLRNWGAPPPDDCPLVPVPPHGRLIDADAFKKYITVSFEEVAPELEGGYKWLAERVTNDLLKDIDDAPTIIEAEEGE